MTKETQVDTRWSHPRAGAAVSSVAIMVGLWGLAACGDSGAATRRPEGSDQVAPGANSPEMTEAEDHGDHGPDIAPVPLTDAERAQLDSELARARRAARRYPTVGDALADGFVVSRSGAGRGNVHLVRWDRMDDRFDIEGPELLLALTEDPGAPVVALVYYSVTGAPPPPGFAGENDHWHRHQGICRVGDHPVGESPDMDRSDCDRLGGAFGTVDGWMLHAWVVDGWENPKGVFVSSGIVGG